LIGCLAGQLRAVLDNLKNGKVDSRPFYSNLFPYECNGSRIVVSYPSGLQSAKDLACIASTRGQPSESLHARSFAKLSMTASMG
jgi:hypothetical protein